MTTYMYHIYIYTYVHLYTYIYIYTCTTWFCQTCSCSGVTPPAKELTWVDVFVAFTVLTFREFDWNTMKTVLQTWPIRGSLLAFGQAARQGMAISRVLWKLSQDLATSLTMFQYVSHATGGPIQSQTSRGLEIATVSTCHGVTGGLAGLKPRQLFSRLSTLKLLRRPQDRFWQVMTSSNL